MFHVKQSTLYISIRNPSRHVVREIYDTPNVTVQGCPVIRGRFTTTVSINLQTCYCSYVADKAANERAEYGPHRDPLKPAR